MIRTERLVQSFLELTAIDNPTLYERELSECLRRRFAALGIVLAEDGAGAAIGGNAGNLYAYLPGDETLAPILLLRIWTRLRLRAPKSLCCTQTDALPQTGRQSSAQTMYPASVQFWKL